MPDIPARYGSKNICLHNEHGGKEDNSCSHKDNTQGKSYPGSVKYRFFQCSVQNKETQKIGQAEQNDCESISDKIQVSNRTDGPGD